MDFFGINAEGVLIIPRVQSLPIYDYTKYERSIYFQESDNLLYLGVGGDETGSWKSMMIDPTTTSGDIIFRNTTNVMTKLGKGTNRQVLTSGVDDISWKRPSMLWAIVFG